MQYVLYSCVVSYSNYALIMLKQSASYDRWLYLGLIHRPYP